MHPDVSGLGLLPLSYRVILIQRSCVSVKVGFEPLHEFHVVQRPGLDEFVDLNWLQQGTYVNIWAANSHVRS